jgi:uncharacterized membrane protein
MNGKAAGLALGLIALSMLLISPAAAQQPDQRFVKARVVDILEEGEQTIGGAPNLYQVVKVRILDAPEAGSEIVIEHGGRVSLAAEQTVHVGQTVVLLGLQTPDGRWEYQISDSYRLDKLMGIAVFFVVLVLVISR